VRIGLTVAIAGPVAVIQKNMDAVAAIAGHVTLVKNAWKSEK
jgi:hypothetical protein